ncbi:MAG: PilW family protein [Rudaea sp.]|nr:PilW family protein [Rudaea sp.]
MTATSHSPLRSSRRSRGAAKGFTLIELMIAIALGILLSLGLVSLFGATSKTNRVQQMMADVQDNGRFAITQISNDLRLASRSLMNASGYSAASPGANGAVNLAQAPNVYVAAMPFPDGSVGPPAGWTSTTASYWPLSPAYFIKANYCSAGACAPTAVPSYVAATGTTTAGQRVPNTDVLTVRYLNSEGWTSYRGEVAPTCAAGFLTFVTLTPAATPASAFVASNFQAGDLAMLTSSSGDMNIFKVGVAGAVLTPVVVAPYGPVPCPGSGEVKLFNFSRNFITVTYWLALDNDPSVAGRFIPALMRTTADNTGVAPINNELVQGVEQMTFLFGVQNAAGAVQFFNAGAVVTNSSAANCPAPPAQYVTFIPGTYETSGGNNICLWRAVKNVETHILVNGINDLFTLTAPELVYQFNGTGALTVNGVSYNSAPAPTATMPATGLKAGSMIRREFVSLTSIRNYNP